MKILYAIQGTGNGHLSRARDIIPILQKKGDVDILVSGTQHHPGWLVLQLGEQACQMGRTRFDARPCGIVLLDVFARWLHTHCYDFRHPGKFVSCR